MAHPHSSSLRTGRAGPPPVEYVDAELAMAEIVIGVRELLLETLGPGVDVRGELEEAAADVWVLNLTTPDGAVLSGVFTGHLPPEDSEWLVFLRPAGRGPESTVSRPMRTPEVHAEVRSFVADARRRQETGSREGMG